MKKNLRTTFMGSDETTKKGDRYLEPNRVDNNQICFALLFLRSAYLSKRDRFHKIRPRGYKTFFMLNSTEHEIFPAHKC